MYPAPFGYRRAGSLREATQMLASLGPDAKVLAGGQTLIPMMKLRLLKPATLVDISRIEEARGIRRTASTLEIGALTTHEAVAASAEAREFPILNDCAGGIADVQVRSLGTIAGSLAEADPSSCWPTLLIALDASVLCVSPGGERVQKVRELLKDAYSPALGPAELIGKVIIDLQALSGSGAFVAFKRAAAAYPTASCALQLQLRGDSIQQARLSLGCVGLTPIAVDVNAALAGRKLDAALGDEIGALAAARCEPLSDNKGSADYKRTLVRGLVRRAFRISTARARGLPDNHATHTYYG
jgi:carbon-monoxide dehydrogenase medium subunit